MLAATQLSARSMKYFDDPYSRPERGVSISASTFASAAKVGLATLRKSNGLKASWDRLHGEPPCIPNALM